MKQVTLAIAVLLLAGAAGAQSRPAFSIQIGADGQGNPQFTLTNLTSKTLSACVFRLGFSHPAGARGEMVWDSLLGESQWPGGEPHEPIPPSQSETLNLADLKGLPLPDKIDVLAGVWSDGESFGDKSGLNEIYGFRASELAAYELGISVLQQALDKNWTADQLLTALNDKPTNMVVSAIRAAFGPLSPPHESSNAMKHRINSLILGFRHDAELLRAATPSFGLRDATTSPSGSGFYSVSEL